MQYYLAFLFNPGALYPAIIGVTLREKAWSRMDANQVKDIKSGQIETWQRATTPLLVQSSKGKNGWYQGWPWNLQKQQDKKNEQGLYDTLKFQWTRTKVKDKSEKSSIKGRKSFQENLKMRKRNPKLKEAQVIEWKGSQISCQ